MYLIHIQVKARQDLKKILIDSITEWGLVRAEAYYDTLATGIESLADNPMLGFARDDIKAGYRQLSIEKHDVFYRISSGRIRIIRILHQRMLKAKHL